MTELPDDSHAPQPYVPAGDRLALFTADEVSPPPEFVVAKRDLVDQMVLEHAPERSDTIAFSDLTKADVPEILDLVQLTKPGPFGPRTIELGRYIGVRVGGRLVAMAGERMKMDGYTEISAVCVHPTSRGQGLAAELILAVARIIRQRGDIPFLHVFASNAPAIALYLKLGFNVRRRMHLAVVHRAE
jgi:predicted GNAT family acetyltransferase